jgi:hypothetical protein
MGKPIPVNPNTTKVTAPQSDAVQKEVRVVVIPPAESSAEPDAHKGSSLRKGIERVRRAIPKGGSKR